MRTPVSYSSQGSLFKTTVFLVVRPCISVDGYQRFEWWYCSFLRAIYSGPQSSTRFKNEDTRQQVVRNICYRYQTTPRHIVQGSDFTTYLCLRLSRYTTKPEYQQICRCYTYADRRQETRHLLCAFTSCPIYDYKDCICEAHKTTEIKLYNI
jgi:hypothetical protein